MTEPSPEDPSPPPRSVIRNRSFVLYAAMRLFNNIAIQMLTVAVGWQLYQLTSDPLDLGLVGLAQFAPVFALFLLAGVASDQYDRRAIIVICNLAHVGVAALLLAYALSGAVAAWPIFMILVLHGATRAFFQPASQAILPNIVERRLFASAVAYSSAVLKGGHLAGPALGGVLIALIGDWVYLVALACFGLAAAAAAPVVSRGTVQPKRRLDFATLMGGFQFVWRKKLVLGAVSLDLIAVLFSSVMGILPVFARDILHVGPEGLGLMRTMPAAGALLVGLVLTQIAAPRYMGPTMLIATGILGLATIAFSLSEVFWISLVALAVIGGGDMFSVYIRQTVMQIATPDDMRGRVSAVSAVSINASNELGDFRAGAMAAAMGTVPAVLIGGGVTVVVAGLWWRLFPELRRVDRLDRI